MQFSLKNTKIQKPIFYHANIIFNQFKVFFSSSYFTPFLQFHTFFHTFFNFFFVTARLLNYTNQLKKKVSLYLSRFSNFAWVQVCDIIRTHGRTDARTHGRTDELLDHNTLSWPKGPQAKIKLFLNRFLKQCIFRDFLFFYHSLLRLKLAIFCCTNCMIFKR